MGHYLIFMFPFKLGFLTLKNAIQNVGNAYRAFLGNTKLIV